jgi:hypothetical protein
MGKAKSRRNARDRFALPPRFLNLLVGAAIGAAWGLIMWIFFSLTGDAGGRELIYVVGTSAMIGGGVAAMFGTVGAKRKGERLFPRLPYRRIKRR